MQLVQPLVSAKIAAVAFQLVRRLVLSHTLLPQLCTTKQIDPFAY